MFGELWTVQEIAKNYRLKESWIYQHMAELPHFKLGNLVRFDPDELQDHLRKLHRGPVAANSDRFSSIEKPSETQR